MRWLVPVVLVMSACGTSGPGDPAAGAIGGSPPTTTVNRVGSQPTPTPSGPAAPGDDAGRPVGFEARQAVVTGPDGETCEICVWLAETATQRSLGLMHVTDLGVGDAMAFRYPEPHTGTFWMKDTILPLSIAFFAPGGTFMASFDMEPCTTSDCPSYGTPDEFLVALEVPRGGLADLGVVPGSTLDLLDLPCD